MEYARPQIVASAEAVAAIQGSPKDNSGGDTNGDDYVTISAYEADE
jgi:hypothetical protein